MYRIVVLYLLLLLFSSCNNEKRNSLEIIKEYVNKELKLETKYLSYSSNDQVYDTTTIKNNRLKLVSFYNTNICLSCIDELQLWSPFVKEYEQDTAIEFLFLIKTDKHMFEHHIKPYIKTWGNNLRICFDSSPSFQTKNDISDQHFLNTFLIGKDNKIILVGNPLYNDELMKLYKKKIKP